MVFSRRSSDLKPDREDIMPLSTDAMFCVQLGIAARRLFFGPGIENLDLALLKSLYLTDCCQIPCNWRIFV